MTIRLDPSLPVLWRTPHSLQLGVDQPVVLDSVWTGTEQLVAALQTGFPGAIEDRLANAFGLEPAEFRRVIATLEPVIERDDVSSSQARTEDLRRIVVDGVGPTADAVRRILAEETTVRIVGSDDAGQPSRAIDLAVLCGDYVLPPSRYARWLRDDVPHLPVVFGDRLVTIGPFVTPGDGPCMHCVDLHRADEDPAWAALASQLLERRSPLGTALLCSEVAARVVRLVLRRLDEDRPVLAGTQLIVEASSGGLRRRVVREHSRCACRALPGIATAPAVPRAAGLRPTTGSADASRG